MEITMPPAKENPNQMLFYVVRQTTVTLETMFSASTDVMYIVARVTQTMITRTQRLLPMAIASKPWLVRADG